MELDIQALSIATGVFIPLLVGVVTKLQAPSSVKAIANAGLSALGGALATVITNSGHLVWREFLIAVGLTWVVSVATHYGLWRPTGATDAVGTKTQNIGIGG